MKKVKLLKEAILGIIIVSLICLAGNILNELLTADEEEVLIKLLTKPENMVLNTTREKNNYCSYQIVNGILYLNGKDGFCQYDFAEQEWETIWSGEVYDYQVVGRNVYCMEPANNSGSSNSWNILSRNLKNLNEKKVLIEKVFDCIFDEGCIYYSCFDENSDKRYIWQFDTNTLKSRVVFSIDLQVDEEIRYGEMVIASEQYFVFCENGGAWIYNRKTDQWNSFKMDFKESNLYFWFHDIQADETYLYVQGLVCDNRKSDIAGPYVEKDADENGIWQVNLKTGERKQMTNKIYYGGIYILDGILYAIDNGKYEMV